jgi:multisubunit Na+/H+ antiporter MnhG subunit
MPSLAPNLRCSSRSTDITNGSFNAFWTEPGLDPLNLFSVMDHFKSQVLPTTKVVLLVAVALLATPIFGVAIWSNIDRSTRKYSRWPRYAYLERPMPRWWSNGMLVCTALSAFLVFFGATAQYVASDTAVKSIRQMDYSGVLGDLEVQVGSQANQQSWVGAVFIAAAALGLLWLDILERWRRTAGWSAPVPPQPPGPQQPVPAESPTASSVSYTTAPDVQDAGAN